MGWSGSGADGTLLGRAYLRLAEWIAVRLAADHLVSDARAIARYFEETYGADLEYLTIGAYVLNDMPECGLDRWELRPGAFYLVACRIEPENNIDMIVEEFLASGSERELVIAGGMNYQTPYWAHCSSSERVGGFDSSGRFTDRSRWRRCTSGVTPTSTDTRWGAPTRRC
jgi:hypothetical protein